MPKPTLIEAFSASLISAPAEAAPMPAASNRPAASARAVLLPCECMCSAPCIGVFHAPCRCTTHHHERSSFHAIFAALRKPDAAGLSRTADERNPAPAHCADAGGLPAKSARS